MEQLFQKLNELISEYDNFIIMGHKDPDLDSLGSSLGLCEIISSFKKNAYLFFDIKHLEKYNANINQAFNKMQKDITCIYKNTYKKIFGKTLLIIVDAHSKERLECEELSDVFDTIVLDHHIKNKNYLKNTKFIYIDSNLSSMSELITYYAEYINLDLDNIIATILLAGVEIDTNGFNLKTTSSTYLSASILMEMGADSILKQELLKETKEDYIKRANFIRNSFMVNENIAMCIVNKTCSNVELAEIAEELLTFEDVKASFVIGKLNETDVGISARSLGEIDVSNLVAQLGGGGHNSNAAAQLKNKTLKEVKLFITDLVKKDKNI